ncbi:MAG TPA: tetratricopeptide repeat protein [Actinomycetes bacterium]|nr:tetratricopeptide repeat protein [Actinomycetes bacterium]
MVHAFSRRRAPATHVAAAADGDAARLEGAARARLERRANDRGALSALTEALVAQRRFAEAATASRRLVDHNDRTYSGGGEELEAHARVLLLGVESGQLCLDEVREELDTTLDRAQRVVGSGAVLAGTHALHALVTGRYVEAEAAGNEALRWRPSARERADALLTLARVYAATDRASEAETTLAEARTAWPDNPRLAQPEAVNSSRA